TRPPVGVSLAIEASCPQPARGKEILKTASIPDEIPRDLPRTWAQVNCGPLLRRRAKGVLFQGLISCPIRWEIRNIAPAGVPDVEAFCGDRWKTPYEIVDRHHFCRLGRPHDNEPIAPLKERWFDLALERNGKFTAALPGVLR